VTEKTNETTIKTNRDSLKQEVKRIQDDYARRKASNRPIPACVNKAYRKVIDEHRQSAPNPD
jgi:hypothetical protein